MQKNIALLGASNKPDRYAYKALTLLIKNGYKVFPISSRTTEINGLNTYTDLSEITEPIDTLTMYVNSQVSSKLADKILKLKPRRVIFNPGSENRSLEEILRKNNIEFIIGCTLVMLTAKTF